MAIMIRTDEGIITTRIIIRKEIVDMTPHIGKKAGIVPEGKMTTTDTQDSPNKNNSKRTSPTTPNQPAQNKKRINATQEVLRILFQVITRHPEGIRTPVIIF